MREDTKLAYTIEEVVALTGLSKDSLYAAIRDQRLPARKYGTRTLVLASDLDRFLNSLPPLNLGPESDGSKRGRRVRAGRLI